MIPRILNDLLDARSVERWAPRAEVWQAFTPHVPLLDGFDADSLERLRRVTGLILARKEIHGAQGQEVTDAMRLIIATQAALPILELGMDWYRNWSSIVVYPGEFATRHEWMDDDGVVHDVERSLIGEARHDGPVVLSWLDSRAGIEALTEGNVILHEFAHKLDMLNGDDVNGFPPLHVDMPQSDWTRAFQQAFDDLRRRVEGGEDTPIDPYASSEEGEFFAVSVEVFFAMPDVLQAEYPLVYRQLAQLFRQDPLIRQQRRNSQLSV